MESNYGEIDASWHYLKHSAVTWQLVEANS